MPSFNKFFFFHSERTQEKLNKIKKKVTKKIFFSNQNKKLITSFLQFNVVISNDNENNSNFWKN